jgi:hypothetical protein
MAFRVPGNAIPFANVLDEARAIQQRCVAWRSAVAIVKDSKTQERLETIASQGETIATAILATQGWQIEVKQNNESP